VQGQPGVEAAREVGSGDHLGVLHYGAIEEIAARTVRAARRRPGIVLMRGGRDHQRVTLRGRRFFGAAAGVIVGTGVAFAQQERATRRALGVELERGGERHQLAVLACRDERFDAFRSQAPELLDRADPARHALAFEDQAIGVDDQGVGEAVGKFLARGLAQLPAAAQSGGKLRSGGLGGWWSGLGRAGGRGGGEK